MTIRGNTIHLKNGDKVLSCGEVVDVDNQPVSLHITGEVIDNLKEDLNGDNIYKFAGLTVDSRK